MVADEFCARKRSAQLAVKYAIASHNVLGLSIREPKDLDDIMDLFSSVIEFIWVQSSPFSSLTIRSSVIEN